MRNYTEYEAVKKFPIFQGYLEHFGQTSMKNDIPGMLSFFFLQGQAAVPYVRIPWGASHIDPRVHVFWIQPSRSGKSVAWEFMGDICRDAEIPTDMYTTGTDAALIGGWEENIDEDGEHVKTLKEGLLDGRKVLNFDEGSIILSPNKHSQETVLYLQSACNPVGSNNNILVKHTKAGRIETESLVSLWITTFPPKGVKDYVLTKGIFQRVLLYWGEWDTEKRREVSNLRMNAAFKKIPKLAVDYQEIVDYFNNLTKNLRDRLLNLSETTFIEWESMPRSEQEELIQKHMHEMFNADETFYSACFDAIDDYYTLLNGLAPGIGEVVASFMPAVENYTVIFATHMAMLDNSWTVTGEHVDMAKDILYDLTRNLILWLEDEVEVGFKKTEVTEYRQKFTISFQNTGKVDFDDSRGEGWVRKERMLKTYEDQAKVTRGTAWNHFNKYAKDMFETTKESRIVYLRLKQMD
jgi:broad specificity phosphatase PhoE